MDPASAAVGITSGAVTLAALALNLGRALKGIVTAYKQSAAVIYSLIGACKAIELAWDRIDGWVKSQFLTSTTEDSAFYEQLTISIEVGKAVLGSLEQDLEGYADIKPGQYSANSTWKLLLSEDVLRDHCTRLTLQLSSLQLLLATASLPAPETRHVLCDYLKPVFRKDEESGWTIVASATRSSVFTSESGPRKEGEETASLHSVRDFSFINDLLTAPVYKRLTLKMLRGPTPVPNHSKAQFSKVARIGEVRPGSRATQLGASYRHTFNPVKVEVEEQITTSSQNDITRNRPDLPTSLAHGAEAFFSSSAFSDLEQLQAQPMNSKTFTSRYLPISATVRRWDMTAKEQFELDLQLLQATRDGSAVRMAICLDMGADINASPSSEHRTPLRIAIQDHDDENAALFLLHYKNVNVHVRDEKGRTLLHHAVSSGKLGTIQRLTDMGVSMDEPDGSGVTPGMIATSNFVSTNAKHIIEARSPAFLRAGSRQPVFGGHV